MRTGLLWAVAAISIVVGLIGSGLPRRSEADGRRERADAHRLAATQQLAEGDPDEATRSALEALALDPDEAASWVLLGDLRQRQERWNEALAAYVRATELDGHLFRPWLQLGRVHRALGQPVAAQEALARARQLDPDHPDAANESAWLAEERGDLQHALDLLELAAKRTRGARRAAIEARIAGLQERRGNRPAALEAVKAAANADPANADRWAELARSYEEAGRGREAAVALERQAALEATPQAWERAGDLHADHGARERAFAAYLQANQTGDRPAAWVGIGRLRLKAGDGDGAAEAADRALAARGSDDRSSTTAALGALLVDLGRPAEAAGVLQPLAAAGDAKLLDTLARAQAGAGHERRAMGTCRRIRLSEGGTGPGPFCQGLLSRPLG